MTITRLEDLKVWQEARKLRKMIYDAAKDFPPEEKFNTTKHFKECGRNIPGNIAEGFGRYHYLESLHFYRIARGSLTELKSDTYCAIDEQFMSEEKSNKILEQIELVSKMLNGLIASTQKMKSSLPVT